MDTEIPVPLAQPVGVDDQWEFVEEEAKPPSTEPKKKRAWDGKGPTPKLKKAKEELNQASELDRKIKEAIEKRKAGMDQIKNDTCFFSLQVFVCSC